MFLGLKNRIGPFKEPRIEFVLRNLNTNINATVRSIDRT